MISEYFKVTMNSIILGFTDISKIGNCFKTKMNNQEMNNEEMDNLVQSSICRSSINKQKTFQDYLDNDQLVMSANVSKFGIKTFEFESLLSLNNDIINILHKEEIAEAEIAEAEVAAIIEQGNVNVEEMVSNSNNIDDDNLSLELLCKNVRINNLTQVPAKKHFKSAIKTPTKNIIKKAIVTDDSYFYWHTHGKKQSDMAIIKKNLIEFIKNDRQRSCLSMQQINNMSMQDICWHYDKYQTNITQKIDFKI